MRHTRLSRRAIASRLKASGTLTIGGALLSLAAWNPPYTITPGWLYAVVFATCVAVIVYGGCIHAAADRDGDAYENEEQ